jgi:plastocyanin
MSRFRPIALTACLGLALTLAACGNTAQAGPAAGFHWWPSTPIATPNEVALGQPSATSSPAAAPQVGQGQASGLGTPAQTVNETTDSKFAPNTVTVKTGDVIQWDNKDPAAHNVTFDGNGTLTSGTMQLGDTWQVKITVAGSYSYHCTLHAGMNGTITVGG